MSILKRLVVGVVILSAIWVVGYLFAGFQVAWMLVVASIVIGLIGIAIT